MIKTAAIATLALGLTCLAQPPAGPGNSRLKSQLGLTDAQAQNLRTMHQQFRQSTESTMQELHTKQKALRDQLNAGSTDAAALGRLMIDAEAARKRADAARQTFREQAVAALTPDQKARLAVLENAMKLEPEIREAQRMGLLSDPNGGDMMMGGHGGPGGPGGRRAGGPPPPPPGGGGANTFGRGPRGPRFDQ